MKLSEIFWTPFALSQLDEIFNYLAAKSKSITPAKKVTNKIIERTDHLIRFPESGQVEQLLKDIGQKSRYIVEGNYKIIYEYHKKENIIIITDLFHTKQNPSKLLKPKNI